MKEMRDNLRELASLDAGEEKLNILRISPLGIMEDLAGTYGVMAEEKGLRCVCKPDPSLLDLMCNERRVELSILMHEPEIKG